MSPDVIGSPAPGGGTEAPSFVLIRSYCHCEERSDEAIRHTDAIGTTMYEITRGC